MQIPIGGEGGALKEVEESSSLLLFYIKQDKTPNTIY